MSDENKIKIGLEATGGKEAVDAVDKVIDAVDGVTAAVDNSGESAPKLEAVTTALEGAGAAAEEAGKKLAEAEVAITGFGNPKYVGGLRTEVEKATEALTEMETEVVSATEAVKDLGGGGDDEAGPLDDLLAEIQAAREKARKLGEELGDSLEQGAEGAEEASDGFGEMAEGIETIKNLELAQAAVQMGSTLQDLAKKAREMGFEKVADGLDTVGKSMSTVANLAITGMGIKALIPTLAAARTAFFALTASMGPLLVPMVAATAAGLALKKGLESLSQSVIDNADRVAEAAARGGQTIYDTEEAQRQYLETAKKTYDAEHAALEESIDLRSRELGLLRMKNREALAEVDAAAAVATAEVDRDEAAGTISREDAIKKRAAIAKESARKVYEIEKADREAELKKTSADEQAVFDALQAQRDKLAKLEADKTAANAAKITENERKTLEANSKRLAELDKFRKSAATFPEQNAEIEKLEESSRQIVEDYRTRRAELQGGASVATIEKEAVEVKKRIEALEAEYKKFAETNFDTKSKLGSEQRVADIKFGKDDTVRDIRSGSQAESARRAAEDKAAREKAAADKRAAAARDKAARDAERARLDEGKGIGADAKTLARQTGNQVGKKALDEISKAMADGVISAAERGGVVTAQAELNKALVGAQLSQANEVRALMRQLQGFMRKTKNVG